jgi:hypothetical protein
MPGPIVRCFRMYLRETHHRLTVQRVVYLTGLPWWIGRALRRGLPWLARHARARTRWRWAWNDAPGSSLRGTASQGGNARQSKERTARRRRPRGGSRAACSRRISPVPARVIYLKRMVRMCAAAYTGYRWATRVHCVSRRSDRAGAAARPDGRAGGRDRRSTGRHVLADCTEVVREHSECSLATRDCAEALRRQREREAACKHTHTHTHTHSHTNTHATPALTHASGTLDRTLRAQYVTCAVAGSACHEAVWHARSAAPSLTASPLVPVGVVLHRRGVPLLLQLPLDHAASVLDRKHLQPPTP